MVNANSPTAGAGEADSVSSVSASACHIGGPIGVNPGELALVYGRTFKRQTNLAKSGHDIYDEEWGPT